MQDPKYGASGKDLKQPRGISHKEVVEHQEEEDENQHQEEKRGGRDSEAANAAIELAWTLSRGYDASNNTTSASEKSDKRKRKSDFTEEEASLKPYECRFCPMKFSKSQALGGHMNRHRQEREREQLLHARHLVMQQGLSHLVMPAPNCFSSITKYHQRQQQRPTDLSVNYQPKLPASLSTASVGTQYATHMSPTLPTNVSWSSENLLDSAMSPTAYTNQNSVSLDDLVQLVQGHKSGISSSNSVTAYKIQPPNGILYNGEHDTSEPPEKIMGSHICPLTSKTALLSQRQPARSPDAGLSRECERQLSFSNPLFSPAESLVKFGPYDLAPLQHTVDLQSEGYQQYSLASPNSRFHLSAYDSKTLCCSPSEGMRTAASNILPDFNAVSGGQLESFSWALGSSKNVSALNPFLNEEFNLVHGPLNDISLTPQSKMAIPTSGSQGSQSDLSSSPNTTSNMTGRTRDAMMLEASTPSVGVDCSLGHIDVEAK